MTHASSSATQVSRGILQAPRLVPGVRRRAASRGCVVDDPVREAVVRPGDGQMAEAAAILDPAEQHGLAVDQRPRRRFITALIVYGQRSRRQQRVAAVTREKRPR